jgi:glycerol transport system substrate-binding protein
MFGEAGPVLARAPDRPADLLVYRTSCCDTARTCLWWFDGTPMAYGARTERALLKQGMQNGYQDVGSWTFANHDENRRSAAWLYAQFITARRHL